MGAKFLTSKVPVKDRLKLMRRLFTQNDGEQVIYVKSSLL